MPRTTLARPVMTPESDDPASIDWFLVQAAAEKVATLKARGYLAERAASGDLGRILAKSGTATPIPGDELPEGWRSGDRSTP